MSAESSLELSAVPFTRSPKPPFSYLRVKDSRFRGKGGKQLIEPE